MLDTKYFDVIYLVILPNEDLSEQTPFQGFTLGNYFARDYIYKILTLPQNILELKASKIEAIRARVLGITNINLIPIEERLISDLLGVVPTPFNVVYSLESNHDLVARSLKECGRPFLHVSAINKDDAITVGELRFRTIWSYCQNVITHYHDGNIELRKFFDDIIGKKRHWTTDSCKVKTRSHLLTLPNETLLNSFNFGMCKSSHPQSNNRSEYVESIVNGVQEIINIQQMTLGKRRNSAKTGLILTSFGMYKHAFELSKGLSSTEFDRDMRRTMTKALKVVVSQKEYWMQADNDLATLPALSFFFGIRRTETELYTMALSVAACNSFAPVLRLPPGVNQLKGLSKELSSCCRAAPNPNKNKKLNKIFKKLQSCLSQYFYKEYSDLVIKAGRNIKIISNSPLEWLQINNLPIMLCKNTSRIPVTPGNLMFMQTLRGGKINLELNDIKNVLVLRSYANDDIIKNALTNTTKLFGELSEKFKLNIIYKDICSKDEFIAAINGFAGSILVYDGHGYYDNNEDTCGLVVDDKPLNIWELKGQIHKMPSIVILSACDTHAIDSSHVTAANAFLSMGAITVYSTLLPVSAKESAMMVGRLIYRLEEYLPIYLKNYGNVLRWNDLVAGLQRMTYMTELKRYLFMKLNIKYTEKQYKEIGYMFNHFINSEDAAWYEKSLMVFSDHTGIDLSRINNVLSEGFFCETLKYVQLGNPENIVIMQTKPS